MRASPEWDRQRARLRALLFDPAARAAHVEGHAVDALTRGTDRVQLSRTAARLGADLRTRAHRGARTLAETYSGSLEGQDLRALAEAFVASPEWARYGERVDDDRQECLEEAFGRFLAARGVGDPELLRAELIDGVVRALLVQPRAAFRVPPEIAARHGARFAIVPLRGREYLVAAVGGRLVRGPLGPAEAAVLREGGRATTSEEEAARARLIALGFELTPPPAAP